MKTLLIINPNRTEAVTRTLARFARERCPPSWRIATIDAAFGALYISSEASFAVATHATLDAYARWVDGEGAGETPAATLVGCFGDPGLMAVREVSASPAVGLAEAAMHAAARHGRFAVLTGGQRWQPMLWRLARAERLDDRLATIHTVVMTGGQMAADPDRADRVLAAACRELVVAHRLDAIVLGGAGLAGMAARLQPNVPVPIIDSVIAGIEAALAAGDAGDAGDAADSPRAGGGASAGGGSAAGAGAASGAAIDAPTEPAGGWHGLSPALTTLLRERP